MQTSHGYPMLVSRTVGQYRKAREGWAQAGCWTISRGYPTLTAEHIQALIEIAFEAARDQPLQCDCFGLLMRQGHILKGAGRHAHQGGAFVR